MAARRYRLAVTGALLAGTTALAGCSALGIERTDPSSSASQTSGAASESATASPTLSTVQPAFGDDASAPDDGVGSLTVGEMDRWTMSNEDDDIYAAYLSASNSPELAVAQQQQVADWMSEYRTFIEGVDGPGADADADSPAGSPSTSGTGTSPASPTGSGTATTGASATTSGTAAAPVTPQFEAGTATPTPTTSGVSPTGSGTSAPSPTGSGTTSAAAPTEPAVGPQGSGPDEMSLRVVPQLLSEGRTFGVRLYARMHNGQEVREHVRTFWADGGSPVPGQALFTDAGQLRRLVLAEPAGSGAGMLSDAELFASVAFTIEGDVVLYLPAEGASDRRLVIDADTVTPLLSDLGKAARGAAQDATLPVPEPPTASANGSASASPTGSDAPSDAPEPTTDSTQTPETTVTTDN